MLSAGSLRSERGQGTIEWAGLVVLVSAAVGLLAAIAGIGLPGAGLAEAIAARFACAVGMDGDCEKDVGGLALAYGAELATMVAEHAPDLLYEDGMGQLPIDFRDCREDACAVARRLDGRSTRTVGGLPATAFTHVVDCRAQSLAATEAAGADCSGDAAGKVFIQYWLYFPDSQTGPWGSRGYHEDDWESFQVRIGGGETLARASSHHSYNYEGGIGNWASDAGLAKKAGWGAFVGTHHIAAGSHAGHVAGDRDERRRTPRLALRLVPIEQVAAGAAEFAVTPPWLKAVYSEPGLEST